MFTIPQIEDSTYTIHKKKTGTLHGCLNAMNQEQLWELSQTYIDLDEKEPEYKAEYVHFLEERIPLLFETYFNFQVPFCFLFFISLVFADSDAIHKKIESEAKVYDYSVEQQNILVTSFAKKLIHDGMLFHFITPEGKSELVVPKELQLKMNTLLLEKSTCFIPGALPGFSSLCHALTDLYCIVTPEVLQTVCQNFYSRKIAKKDMLRFMKDAALIDGNSYFYRNTLCTFDVDDIDWLFDTLKEERKQYSPFIPSNEEIAHAVERYTSETVYEYDEDNPAYKTFVDFIRKHSKDDCPEVIATELFFYVKMSYSLQEIVDSLTEDYDIVFDSESDAKAFVLIYQNLVNTSHLWVNWGNTPESLSKKEMPFIKPFSKVGRNDPCPCGSGLKFKKCHGKNF